MPLGIEKSIGASFGSTDIFFNRLVAAKNLVNCRSCNKETVKGFVKGRYGEVKFTADPLPPKPIRRTYDIYGGTTVSRDL